MQVLSELQQQFNLADNEVKLLALLKEGSYSVKRLSQSSRVPMGRIYSVLQNLEDKGLVSHRGNPRTYTSQPWDKHVTEFLDREHVKLAQRKQTILDSLTSSSKPHVDVITSLAQLKSQYYSWIVGADYCYYIDVGSAYPLIFFERNEDDTQKILKAILPNYVPTPEKVENRARMWRQVEKCKDERHVIAEETLFGYLRRFQAQFGRAGLERQLERIYERMEKYNIQLRVIPDVAANHMVITNQTMISSIYTQEQILVLKIDSPQIIQAYTELFNQFFLKSAPFKASVDDWLKNNPPKRMYYASPKVGR